MAPDAGKTFDIAYDTSSKRWTPARIHICLKALDPTTKTYEPCEIANLGVAGTPENWLSFSMSQQDKVVVADVSVTDEFARAPGEAKFDKPIPVTVQAWTPKDAEGKQQKLEATCAVQVQAPGIAMGWTVRPEECWKDGQIWLPADAKTVATLSVWVEQPDPESGQVYRAPDDAYQFTWQCDLDKGLLVCTDAQKDVLPADSHWQTPKPRGDLKEPVAGTLRVFAWSTAGQKKRPDGELKIPVSIYSPAVKPVVTFSPELPALAGVPVTIALELVEESRGEPVADTAVALAWSGASKGKPVGALTRDTGRTDAKGIVEFTYTPPDELVYKPGMRLFDEMQIVIGDGEARRALDTPVVVPLAPRLAGFITIRKKGICDDKDAVPFEIAPDLLKGPAVEGSVFLPCEMPEEKTVYFPVANASLSFAFGQAGGPGPTVRSGSQGAFKLVLPELEDAFRRAKLEARPVKLPADPEAGDVPMTTLHAEAAAAIADFEARFDGTRINASLFSDGFFTEVRRYRKTFCEQIAKMTEDKYESALAGVGLVAAALEGSSIYFRRFKCHEDLTRDRFENFLKSLINIGLSVASASDNLKKLGGWLLEKGQRIVQWLANTRFGKWLVRGASWFGDLASQFIGPVRNQLMPYLKSLQDKFYALLERLGNLGRRIRTTVGGIIDSLMETVSKLAGELQERISGFQSKLSEAASRWDELKEWAAKAAKEAAEKIPDWISAFWESLRSVFSTVLEIVGHLLSSLGNLCRTALTSAFAWLCRTGRTLLAPLMEKLAEYGDEVLAKVAKFLEADLKRVASEVEDWSGSFTGSGIGKIIDTVIGSIIDAVIGSDQAKDNKEVMMDDARMRLNLFGREPTKVVGFVHVMAKHLDAPKDWEARRHRFAMEVGDLSADYGDYEKATATIDEVMDIVNTLVTVGGLAIILVGIVVSGGAASAAAAFLAKLTGNIENAFTIIKAAMSDLPQVCVAVVLMVMLVVRYDCLVTQLVIGPPAGGGATA
ncbi:MAG TPA: hypothetical protein PLU72_16260 [Candidatus Ozemobacteraceae bacterium]|nr:hypothetical protein [Candidatus Ozemobacteraceae bacterium]